MPILKRWMRCLYDNPVVCFCRRSIRRVAVGLFSSSSLIRHLNCGLWRASLFCPANSTHSQPVFVSPRLSVAIIEGRLRETGVELTPRRRRRTASDRLVGRTCLRAPTYCHCLLCVLFGVLYRYLPRGGSAGRFCGTITACILTQTIAPCHLLFTFLRALYVLLWLLRFFLCTFWGFWRR